MEDNMKERPIVFTAAMAEMLRAILAGWATQTRRVVKGSLCPYGAPGDRLWVQEPWAAFTGGRVADGEEWDEFTGKISDMRDVSGGPYVHDNGLVFAATDNDTLPSRWRPSIHMPRWASRITLEITGVRIERLQTISDDDARAEGMDSARPYRTEAERRCDDGDREDPRVVGYSSGGSFARQNFQKIWNEINGDGAWEANPLVWVVSFRRVS